MGRSVVFKFFLCIAVSFACTVSFAEQLPPVKWPEKSAVAWQTSKTMFLFKEEQPVGISTDVVATLESNSGNHVLIVTVPVKSFDSGEEERDAEVKKILKADKQENIVFRSEPVQTIEWQDLISGNTSSLKGQLSIGGNAYPTLFQVLRQGKGEQAKLEGRLETTFTDFEIEPPSVAAGLVAKVDDKLILHSQLFLKDIYGLEIEAP